MVDDMDYYIGEVVNYLKKTGQYDNTLILFMSDNGADGNTALDEGRTREWVKTRMDNSLANSGRKGSYIDYGPNWAQVGSNPFHLYKGFLYEGGISVPFIASWPALGRKGQISGSFAHTMDIAPTLLELAGARHPGTEYQGRAVLPLRGRSMLAMLTGQRDSVHPADHVHGWELGGRKALRKGDWKIVYSNRQWGTGEWELYDLSKDRSELNNLAASQPAKLSELVAEYERYVREVGVVDIPGLAERKGYSNGTRYFEDMQ
jgi:arylsulfatase